jgi:ADP-heptose:LPS heptosyltransferase
MSRGGAQVPDRILVIKLGALGDIALALGPFKAIRRAHPGAHITLLTTAPFADFTGASGYFDEVWIDERPTFGQFGLWLDLRKRLRGGGFRRVYDLQTSDRSGWYFRLMAPGRRPEWSGIVPGCSHPHDNPDRDFMHSIERQDEQLAAAGIADVPAADLSWVAADTARFNLAPRYMLLVPSAAPHRPAKRWPAAKFAELAGRLAGDGVAPVILGGLPERALANEIKAVAVAVRDLTGLTTLADIAVLARGAAGAVGNDTGPMHMIAAAGCPSVVLFSADSDPALTAPRGPAVTVLRHDALGALSVDEVVSALSLR